MSLLFQNFKQIPLTSPSTIFITSCIQTQIFFRSYTARKPVKVNKSSAPVYTKEELEDGSIFISRVPLSPEKISHDDLPPPLRPIKQKLYHLTQEQIDEIRQLREQDPVKWTRKKLAEKFECSQFYIGIIAPVSKERKIELEKEIDQKIEKMGWKKKFIRNERARRRELW